MKNLFLHMLLRKKPGKEQNPNNYHLYRLHIYIYIWYKQRVISIYISSLVWIELHWSSILHCLRSKRKTRYGTIQIYRFIYTIFLKCHFHYQSDRVFNGLTIQQYGDGSTSRDYTFIDDIANGVVLAIDKPLGCEVNILFNII